MADVSQLITLGIGAPAGVKFILTSGLGIGAPTATVSAMSMWLEREHGVSLAAARESRLVFHEHAEARLALVESEG